MDGYWEYRLKPWDVAAGVLIAEEAGALVTTMDGEPFSVRNGTCYGQDIRDCSLHKQVLLLLSKCAQPMVTQNVGFVYVLLCCLV